MANLITAPRGTKDILPSESYKWHYVEDILRKTAADFGYPEIRFPTFEHTELFVRGVGETTDVVQKEMYTFEDKGGRSITLRPEGTASVVRSYLENSIYGAGLPVKCYYLTHNFRYEKPQSGRFREFHQFGVECFGPAGPEADAEVIGVADVYLKRLGIANAHLEINSIGCPNCRPGFHQALKDYFKSRENELCSTCRERLEKNPLRILDCKSPVCAEIAKGAPIGLDYLCPECEEHFEKTGKLLTDMGIEYIVNPAIVRGLDYYTKTVFEFTVPDIGAQSTVCGGGRYDGLVSALGGQPTPALGFGSGIERLILAMEASGAVIPKPAGVSVFVAAIGEVAGEFAAKLVHGLRIFGISAERDLMGRSLKAQMKYADRIGAVHTLVLGDDEISEGKGILKHMGSDTAQTVALSPEAIAGAI